MPIPRLLAAEERVNRQCAVIDHLIETGQHHRIKTAYQTLAALEHAMHAARKSAAPQARTGH
jgi:hypothetical protein